MRLLAPLRHRDFRLLWSGMCVSLLGDGIFLVAMAWQVYALSNAPTALALVGITMTVPTIAFLLLGGVRQRPLRPPPRHGRRRRRCAGSPSGSWRCSRSPGVLELWHIAALVGRATARATAFFSPSFDALVPEVLPRRRARPGQRAGPVRAARSRCASRGRRSAACSSTRSARAPRFALDAASFVVSAVALLAMARGAARRGRGARHGRAATSATGLRYVRSHVWLWATFASAAIAYLLFMGPAEVLLPFLVKNDLRRLAPPTSASSSPPGGIGSVGCAVVIGQRGLPRRDITFMYVTWTLATLAVAGYGLATAVWQLMLASLAFNALETAGTIVWATAKQRHVPAALLGRVSSLDWLISIGLLPLSFALTGPVSGAIGARDDAHRRRPSSAPSSPSRRCSCPACAPSRAQKIARPDEHEDHDHHHDGNDVDERPEGLLLGAQRVAARSEDVDRRVDDDPHHVDEVPVDARHLDAAVLLGRVVAAEGAHDDHQRAASGRRRRARRAGR